MKLKNNFFFTLREDVKDEESNSGNLLVRAGYVKKAASGIYTYLPLGFKTLKNIEKIICEEMDREGALQLVMPSLLPMEVYENSGRREVFGHNMFSLKDRYEREYTLGPTHEEMFTDVAKDSIKSYKDMPINLYQVANKYRDETRPRYGLIRVREFVMKDAYSFDRDLEGLDVAYSKMFNAYKRIFDRCGLEYKIVTADTGSMGGLLSEEFQAVTDIGEDILVLCDKCDYASNIEVSKCVSKIVGKNIELLEKELISTPDVKTIDELVNNYGFELNSMVKNMLVKYNDHIYLCMVKSDREVNLVKTAKILGVPELEFAEVSDIEKVTNAKVGFAGPIGINIPIIVDEEILLMKNFLVGANKTDYHYKNVNIRDFEYNYSGDIKNICEGDSCPKCGGNIYFKKGIEVGNTFKIGTKYSESLNLKYLDEFNTMNPVVMGSYGIGLGRIIASVAEQSNDEYGLSMPISIAPYKVAIVIIDINDNNQVSYANKLYDELMSIGIDTILDDRDERPGIKFKDMDLIGIPIRVTVGRGLANGNVEYKLRTEKEVREIPIEEIKNIIDLEVKKS